MIRLASDSDLADEWGISLERFHELRKRHDWPHVRLGRFEFRFTEDQIAQIVASRSVTPAKKAAGESGLTERSAKRAS